ncbi:MAG: diacylglycerol/lipid kinase family protein [Halanaerobiales bacterium]
MKRCKLIYNPTAGNRSFPAKLDKVINRLQTRGFLVDIYRTTVKDDLYKGIETIKKDNYHNIIAAGGDGSLSIIVNSMLKNNINIPIGIIPTGTANDFATYLNIPFDTEKAVDIISDKNIESVDIGKINKKYFVNVCLVGEIASVSEDTNSEFKTLMGKLAYYLNGIKEIANINPVPYRIETTKSTIEEKLFMFVIMNSSGAGGFKNLNPGASINDGLFDFIGVRFTSTRDLYKLPTLLMQVLQGEHLSNKDVLHLKDKYFKIECLDSSSVTHHCDIDGERGPELPLRISVLPGKLRMYSNKIKKH